METRARHAFDAFSSDIAQYPSAYPQALTALDFAIGPSREIVIAGELNDSTAQAMVRMIYQKFLPNKVVAFHPGDGEAANRIEKLSPFIRSQSALGGKATVYVCKNYVCNLPITSTKKLAASLNQ